MLKHSLVILLLFVSIIGFSQDEDTYVFGDNAGNSSNSSSTGGGFDWDRVTVGGGLFLQFGDNSYIAISPTFGYYLMDNVIVGIGGSYVYEENNDPYYINYSANTYSAMIYSQYIFEDLPIILHTELEYATISVKYQDQFFNDQTFEMLNVYVGGGLKQAIGDNSYLYFMGLWNLNETKESNYVQPNPIIRVGIAIGL
jgi:hypothetical protein